MEKLMALQKYIRQLRPIQESYVDHVDRVQTFLGESYDFYPKSEKEIQKTLKDFPSENVKDIIKLFNLLKTKDKTPINIDLKRPKEVNVSRTISDIFDIKFYFYLFKNLFFSFERLSR